MDTVVEIEEFRHAMNELVGKPLGDAVAGETTGTAVLFKFGRKFRAKDVYENPTVSEEDIFVGELSMMVGCSWRIEAGETRLLCGCGDLHNEGGPMLIGLQKLVGDIVAEVSLSSFLDLLVVFNGGKRLRLFCDQNGHENDDDSYQLCTAGGQVYGVITGLIELVNGG